MVFVLFALSSANTVNFSQHLIRTIQGVPEQLKENCGISATNLPVKASPLSHEWPTKGISLGAIVGTEHISARPSIFVISNHIYIVVCFIHSIYPILGIWISNILAVVKLIMLMVVVITGFVALRQSGGTDNFKSFHGEGDACVTAAYHGSSQVANYALALIQVRPTSKSLLC